MYAKTNNKLIIVGQIQANTKNHDTIFKTLSVKNTFQTKERKKHWNNIDGSGIPKSHCKYYTRAENWILNMNTLFNVRNVSQRKKYLKSK